VNAGHALLNADLKDDDDKNYKKKLLASLIRATHFNPAFFKDKKLLDIYEKSISSYKELSSLEKNQKKENNLSFSPQIDQNKENLIPFIGVLLSVIGISLNNVFLRYLLGTLGIATIFLNYSWKKSWTEVWNKKSENIIDNSIEYLEIKFEDWLKNHKDKKLVFIIDELDKIEQATAFKVIKEFKNLFTQSFSHFLFIAGQEAFNLINEDREDKENGIFPTLFTHVLYLPLPKSNELKKYLDEIFIKNNHSKDKDIEDLKNYLLFKSHNDYFSLKRLISDFISFNDNDEPLLDIDAINNYDRKFSLISKLYLYVEKSIEKNLKSLKRYWFENSKLQKDFYEFLDKKFPNNFLVEPSENNENISLLIKILLRGKIIKESSKDQENNQIYIWTNKFSLPRADDLFDEEKEFLKSFDELIRIANDLDDLPAIYEKGEFDNYKYVAEGRDGSNLSGINLYSIYTQYQDIKSTIDDPDIRIEVKIEDVQEALKNIKQNIENVLKAYFEIFINTITKINTDNPIFFAPEKIDSPENNIPNVFSSLPTFIEKFQKFENRIIGKNDNTKYAIFVKEFNEFDQITEGLKSLYNQRHLLVLNLAKKDKFQKSSPTIKITLKNKKRRVKVKNFINITISDFRDFPRVLKLMINHLNN